MEKTDEEIYFDKEIMRIMDLILNHLTSNCIPSHMQKIAIKLLSAQILLGDKVINKSKFKKLFIDSINTTPECNIKIRKIK